MAGDRRLAWRGASAVMTLMFAASVIVQINDPDPIHWMAIYGAAAVVAALETAGRPLKPYIPAGLGVVALGWAATIAPRVIGKVPFTSMFGAFEMKNVGIEESREMYGLVLVGGWMLLTALVGRRRPPG